MSQGPIPIDPRLLGAVKRALWRMPAVPYDLTKVKVLDNFYSPVDPYWDNVPEGFVLTLGSSPPLGAWRSCASCPWSCPAGTRP